VVNRHLLIVGNPAPIHLGAHFLHAAQAQGLSVKLCDSRVAFTAPWPLVKFNWWLRGRRPTWLKSFSEQLVENCRQFRPRWLLATGISPIGDQALAMIGKFGTLRLNFLTDDPWNLAHRAPWFLKALPHYDHVFSPRRANLEDLRRLGCTGVSYLPFAYAPEIHFPELPRTAAEHACFSADVIFAGGADADRVEYMTAIVRAGFKLALYGGYWEQFPALKLYSRGYADAQTLRKAIGGAKVALCLVRQANRDGHSMRTFEVPAVGACMLMEDTEEHREIFGEAGQAVVYFSNTAEMIDKLSWLLAHDEERQRLALVARQMITQGKHAYRDRLTSMLALTAASCSYERDTYKKC
jgi:spore maturation protein CgeB